MNDENEIHYRLKNLMKKVLCFVLFLASVLPASAQDPVAAIRQRYAAVKAHIEEMMQEDGWPPSYYETNIVENLPGTGPHRENIKMFYDVDEEKAAKAEDEDFDFTYHVHPPVWLHFVMVSYNFAARNFYEEYLLDKNGKPEFIYGLMPYAEDEMDREFRFYFHDGKLIRLVVKRRATGTEEPFAEEYSGNKLLEKYEDYYNNYVSKLPHFLRLFEAVDKVTYY